ncbi:MAG: hypothetical protein DRN29_07810 [Thermoplasmata archaeon]|nr:MAG: hypothetical protein DRN29_07810 [Thermoplasmata archaeon]
MLRKKFHAAIYPLTNFLGKHGIKPNLITTLSIILLAPTCYFLLIYQKIYFIMLLIIISFLDALDGAIAENAGMKTDFGSFYDAFADRVVEGVIYFSIAIAYEDLALLCFIALILSYLTSYIAAWKKNLKYVGIGSRAERMAILIVSFVIDEVYYGLIIISALSFITIIHRFYHIAKENKC